MTAQQVTFHITSGLPFAKQLVVTLPTSRSYWNLLAEFEVRAQIREAIDDTSALLLDLASYLTVTFVPATDPDEVTIDLVMTGDDTRLVIQSGFYDFIISDPYATDARAINLLKGAVTRTAIVTSGGEAAP